MRLHFFGAMILAKFKKAARKMLAKMTQGKILKIFSISRFV